MKFSAFSVVALAASAMAVPMSLMKRADVFAVAPYGYATMNGGTTGGAGAEIVKVSTLAALQAAASADGKSVIMITSSITGTETIMVTSDKTIVGASSKVVLTGCGFIVKRANNVILRNLTIKKVKVAADKPASGDAITIYQSTNVWVDHCDLSSDMDHDKDYYDGLLDVIHAADYITVSNCSFHDHWKASLVGQSDSNGSEDKGKLHISYVNNYFRNLFSRAPSVRFGTCHIWNNYFENVELGIDTRDGAQLLVENNVFVNSKKPVYSVDSSGSAVASGNDFGGRSNSVPASTFTKAPYDYTLVDASACKSTIAGSVGAILTFEN